MFLCTMCWETYDRDLSYCPKKSCDGDVVEIDDDLVPVIVELNEKGYITEYCCSGHAYWVVDSLTRVPISSLLRNKKRIIHQPSNRV